MVDLSDKLHTANTLSVSLGVGDWRLRRYGIYLLGFRLRHMCAVLDEAVIETMRINPNLTAHLWLGPADQSGC